MNVRKRGSDDKRLAGVAPKLTLRNPSPHTKMHTNNGMYLDFETQSRRPETPKPVTMLSMHKRTQQKKFYFKNHCNWSVCPVFGGVTVVNTRRLVTYHSCCDSQALLIYLARMDSAHQIIYRVIRRFCWLNRGNLTSAGLRREGEKFCMDRLVSILVKGEGLCLWGRVKGGVRRVKGGVGRVKGGVGKGEG